MIADRDARRRGGLGAIVSAEAVGFLLGGLISLGSGPERPLVVAVLGILLNGPLFVLLAVRRCP